MNAVSHSVATQSKSAGLDRLTEVDKPLVGFNTGKEVSNKSRLTTMSSKMQEENSDEVEEFKKELEDLAKDAHKGHEGVTVRPPRQSMSSSEEKEALQRQRRDEIDAQAYEILSSIAKNGRDHLTDTEISSVTRKIYTYVMSLSVEQGTDLLIEVMDNLMKGKFDNSLNLDQQLRDSKAHNARMETKAEDAEMSKIEHEQEVNKMRAELAGLQDELCKVMDERDNARKECETIQLQYKELQDRVLSDQTMETPDKIMSGITTGPSYIRFGGARGDRESQHEDKGEVSMDAPRMSFMPHPDETERPEEIRDYRFEDKLKGIEAGRPQGVNNDADARRTQQLLATCMALSKQDSHGMTGAYNLPSVIPDKEMKQTLEAITQSVEHATKPHYVFKSEEKMMAHLLKVLQDSKVRRPILELSLQERKIDHCMQVYEDRYKHVKDSEDGKDKKGGDFEQRKATVKNQDHAILVHMVEEAFTKVSADFKTRCKQQKRDMTEGAEPLSEVKNMNNAGFFYLVEASSYLCRSTWVDMLKAFEDLIESLKFIERACHGSIIKIEAEWAKHIRDFEREYTTINASMLHAMGLLYVVERAETKHMKESIEYLKEKREYNISMSDYEGAKAQLQEVVETIRN